MIALFCPCLAGLRGRLKAGTCAIAGEAGNNSGGKLEGLRSTTNRREKSAVSGRAKPISTQEVAFQRAVFKEGNRQ